MTKKDKYERMVGDLLVAVIMREDYRLGHKYFFYSKGTSMDILPLKNLVWAYYFTKRKGKEEISQIQLYDSTGKEKIVRMSQEESDELLHKLSAMCPHMLIGYKKGWEILYQKDIRTFLNIQYNKCQEAASTVES